MTYSAGNVIQSVDYNGFVSTTVGANVNNVWSTSTGDAGYGQPEISTVVAESTVSATQWSTLNNRITSIANHQNTTITSRTNPVATDTITILTNLGTDIANITTYRGNAVASGSTINSWSGNIAQVDNTGSGNSAWTLTFTNTITFPSADQARYFWNAGGLVRIDMNKTSNATDSDPDWNSFVSTVGTLYISGRVNGADQTIAGTNYTGVTRVGGSGTPLPNLTTSGWYALSPGTSTSVFTLTVGAGAYTGDYINVTLTRNAGSTSLTVTTSWHSAARTAPGETTTITGGSNTASPYTAFGTAPAVLVRPILPASTYITDTWGTPTLSASITVA